MLELYAQEIVDLLCETLDRSVIITDTEAVIIAAPAKERLGTTHPPSVPVIKYGKMSSDDADEARKLGVWYPGATTPIYFQGKVIGSIAIAGEPEVVLKFAKLVRTQVESILREKVLIESTSSAQHSIDDLVKAINCFDPQRDDGRHLIAKAAKFGFTLDIPRVAIAIEFSNFSELNPQSNNIGLSYEKNSDPIQDVLDHQILRNRVIDLIKSVYCDSQDIVSSVSMDRFLILKGMSNEYAAQDNLGEEILEEATCLLKVLHSNSVGTIICIGSISTNIHEIPLSCDNAWDTVLLAEKQNMGSGVYTFHDLAMEHLLFSIPQQPRFSSLWSSVTLIKEQPDAAELVDSFLTYCESMFSKQGAATALFVHRNTLVYRLNKIEKLLNINLSDFRETMSLYILLKVDKLIMKGSFNRTEYGS